MAADNISAGAPLWEKDEMDSAKSEKHLICTVGLPRSGKSTWARTQPYPIVNPDSVRLALHGQRFVAHAEPFVWAIAKTMVRALFLAGHSRVVLDATNVSRKRRDEWQSKDWVTSFHLIDAGVEVCMLRAQQEGDAQIMDVIVRMVAQWDNLGTDEKRW